LINNGRSFVAARRFIVHEDVNDAFIDSFVEAMRPLKIGDTMEAGTDIGPPATGRASVAERVDGRRRGALVTGARPAVGGCRHRGVCNLETVWKACEGKTVQVNDLVSRSVQLIPSAARISGARRPAGSPSGDHRIAERGRL
jgi:hypothetical protein